MSGGTIFLIILTIIVFAALGGTMLSTMVRRLGLRKRFGPEYDKVIAEHENRREGEAELFDQLLATETPTGERQSESSARPAASASGSRSSA